MCDFFYLKFPHPIHKYNHESETYRNASEPLIFSFFDNFLYLRTGLRVTLLTSPNFSKDLFGLGSVLLGSMRCCMNVGYIFESSMLTKVCEIKQRWSLGKV